ncbi:MAG: ATP-grasp domain-containing protein, partial [Lachnospiraceae bacterium]|nr:ATP-grasp domain-containing protein [Lachnospiraceae bacterium]
MKAAIIGASEEALHTIEKAHEYGLTVVALDGNGKAPGLSAADKALVVDISDEEETIRAVREEKAAFVLTVPIGRYLTTIGAVNDALTLPGISKEMAVLCTDKYSFHKTLFEQGLRSCHCYGVGNHLGDETPNDVLAEKLVNGEIPLAFPAILKPRFGSGSRGIHMLNRREELERALQEAEGESYVLEECIEGEEYGVDGAMVGSDFQMVLLRYKRNTPPPARQAVAYFSVQPADPFYEQVKVYMQRVTACLGLRECLLHADLIRGENGPFVIELSARPSGHNLHNLFTPLCTGVDVAEEYIKYRMGKPFCFVPKQTKSMMIHYFDMQGEVKQVPDQVQVEQTLKELHQISENGLPEVSLI